MKNKLAFSLTLLFLASLSFAFPGVWTSSHTFTAETTKNLCGTQGTTNVTQQAILHGICVSTATATAGGLVTVYASSGTAVNPIAIVNTMATGCYFYDVYSSTTPGGLSYTTTAPGASVTFSYACY